MVAFFLSATFILFAQTETPLWGVFELALEGPTAGNPFIGTEFYAEFKKGDQTFSPEGFYDGDGIYRVRFMPNTIGEWTYRTHSNKKALDGKEGTFVCIASADHGPVRVSDTYYFAHEDGTSYTPYGTTIYEWPFQNEERKQQTLKTIQSTVFNKARYLVVPPYKGNYLEGEGKLTDFPFEGDSKENWDFSRFNPDFFKNIEKCVEDLQSLNIQSDLILFRPYDDGKWGFDEMDMETNKRFLRYVVARFAAYHSVWWSMANENSFMEAVTDQEWDELFQLLQEIDPYDHLRSMHNADRIYNYTLPWVTHVSLQYYNAVRVPGVTPLLRDLVKKPVVHDEINYEGDIERRWGQLNAEELIFRFWNAYIGGGFATHGEVYEKSPWISTGGTLTGGSPERIAFLKEIVESAPEGRLEPIDQYYELNMAGKQGEFYLIYFGKDALRDWTFSLPDNELEEGDKFKIDIIDTWNMSVTPVSGVFTAKVKNRYEIVDAKNRKVKLPGKPYLALRIQKLE